MSSNPFSGTISDEAYFKRIRRFLEQMAEGNALYIMVDGEPEPYWFSLDRSKLFFSFMSLSEKGADDGKEYRVELADISEIRPGRSAANKLSMVLPESAEKEVDETGLYYSFYIGLQDFELVLIASQWNDFQTWFFGLSFLLSATHHDQAIEAASPQKRKAQMEDSQQESADESQTETETETEGESEEAPQESEEEPSIDVNETRGTRDTTITESQDRSGSGMNDTTLTEDLPYHISEHSYLRRIVELRRDISKEREYSQALEEENMVLRQLLGETGGKITESTASTDTQDREEEAAAAQENLKLRELLSVKDAMISELTMALRELSTR